MFVEVNGVRLFCEISGAEGKPPLLLLHGNGESHKIFGRLAAALGKDFRVYAPDTRGHGRSSRVGVYHYDDMAEDCARLVEAFGLVRPFVLGFSDGGIVGLLLAMRYPDLLGGLIACGANTSPRALKKPYLRLFRLIYFLTRSPLFRLMLTEPDISAAELAKIKIPVLVAAGRRDLVEEADTRLIAGAIPGAKLMIFEGESHSSYIVGSAFMAERARAFFGGAEN